MSVRAQELLMLEREGARQARRYVDQTNEWMATMQGFVTKDDWEGVIALLAGYARVLIADMGGNDEAIEGLITMIAHGHGKPMPFDMEREFRRRLGR